jgi:hypothetical protein
MIKGTAATMIMRIAKSKRLMGICVSVQEIQIGRHNAHGRRRDAVPQGTAPERCACR